MLPPIKRIATTQTQTAQQMLTWALISLIVVSLLSALLQQAGPSLQGLFLAMIGSAVVGVVAWQFVTIRLLRRRLDRVESILADKRINRPTKPLSPSQVAHFDSEQFFHQGQTKH